MNDRFRFRIWAQERKKFENTKVVEDARIGFLPKVSSNYIVEQCTGLKDKNGQLIYEGDIIAINTRFDFIVSDDYEYKNKSEKGTAYYKVYFDTQKSGFKMALVSFTKDKPRCVVCDVRAWHQVVGNIHKNPELLEAANENTDR